MGHVLYEMPAGRHSPARWAEDARDRRGSLGPGRGITPSRSRCSASRDRLGARLGDGHRPVLPAAVARGLTAAQRGSRDGTTIAAQASRPRRLNLARPDRRPEQWDRAIAAD